MAYAQNGPDWVELQAGRDVVTGDVVSSYATIEMWSPQMRSARGIKAIVDDAIPDGKVATASALVDDAGTPRRSWTLEDAPPPPVPQIISDRQFAQQLAIVGTITQAEAIAWAARGELPAILETAIGGLPEAGGVRFGAQMLLSSATTYERSHPLTETLGGLLGYDAGNLDDLWRAAAAL